ncbi:MAG: acyl-CoA thioesterase, partial [Cellulophaga baltica]
MPKSFHKTIQVTQDDLDDLNHVNNVRYVQW